MSASWGKKYRKSWRCPMNDKMLTNGTLVNLEKASELIKTGKFYACAADEDMLKKLPSGNWIGGTSPYFMGQDGGEVSQEKIYIQEIPTFPDSPKPKIVEYNENKLPKMVIDAAEHGFSILLIPGNSQIHYSFAENAPDYDEMYMKPFAGWITGAILDKFAAGDQTSKVFNGITGQSANNHAIAMHCSLPDNKVATVGIVNLFQPNRDKLIHFDKTSIFNITDCKINGNPANLYDYIVKNKIDIKSPLVGDYHGTMINVTIFSVNHDEQDVTLGAPVFPGIDYYFANPVGDYPKEFKAALPNDISHIGFSCNCLYNFLYGELEGRKTANITGPMSFGEIAYQLVNQTMVYIQIDDI